MTPTVRDATDEDVPAVERLAAVPRAAAERLVRERRVRVADGDGETVGLVAYEADRSAVHVTHLAGGVEAAAALLDEPVSFARVEGLPVEAVVPDSEAGALDAVTAAGFESVGDGPRFAGEPTTRYRLTVDGND